MELEDFFKENPKLAIAFSGGVDSAYLLYAAIKYCASVKAYYVKSAFQPQSELDDAIRLTKELGADMQIIYTDILNNPLIADNPSDRCYHCKKVIFAEIAKAAAKEQYNVLADGTNASDEAADRPGMRALAELSVRSPLKECGLSKDNIRHLSKEAGLFTWDKPAYACLATRIPAGDKITKEKLMITETAENYLSSIGFNDFRVRMCGSAARIQVTEKQLGLALARRQDIVNELGRYYSAVMLDLEIRKCEVKKEERQAFSLGNWCKL